MIVFCYTRNARTVVLGCRVGSFGVGRSYSYNNSCTSSETRNVSVKRDRLLNNMSTKNKNDETIRVKKKKEPITVELKKQIIEMHEQGSRVSEISKFFNKPTSTICTILKKKEQLRDLDVAVGVTRLTKQRPPVLEEVEKLLLAWIYDKIFTGESLTDNAICKEAKTLYFDLLSHVPGKINELQYFERSVP